MLIAAAPCQPNQSPCSWRIWVSRRPTPVPTYPTIIRIQKNSSKTLKYRPDYPERFGCQTDARTWAGAFFRWYNYEHQHSANGLLTPADVHFGRAQRVLYSAATNPTSMELGYTCRCSAVTTRPTATTPRPARTPPPTTANTPPHHHHPPPPSSASAGQSRFWSVAS